MMSASAISGIFRAVSRIRSGAQPGRLRKFLLVFDDGDFDEDDTFLLSDWFKHTPNEKYCPRILVFLVHPSLISRTRATLDFRCLCAGVA